MHLLGNIQKNEITSEDIFSRTQVRPCIVISQLADLARYTTGLFHYRNYKIEKKQI